MSLNQSESQEGAIFHHNMKAYFKTNDETLVTRNKQPSLHDIRSKTNVTEFYSIERITLIRTFINDFMSSHIIYKCYYNKAWLLVFCLCSLVYTKIMKVNLTCYP